MPTHPDALAWAAEAVGPVAEVRALEGGRTSTMLAITPRDGEPVVLRLMTVEPWRTHGAELTARERETQRLLADTPVPAPRSLALDADGGAVRAPGAPHDPAPRTSRARAVRRPLGGTARRPARERARARAARRRTPLPVVGLGGEVRRPALGERPGPVAGRLRAAAHPGAGLRADLPAPRLRPAQRALVGRARDRAGRLGGDLGRPGVARRRARLDEPGAAPRERGGRRVRRCLRRADGAGARSPTST